MQLTDQSGDMSVTSLPQSRLKYVPHILGTNVVVIVLNGTQQSFHVLKKGRTGGGGGWGRVNRFLGCELLESRAVMGITAGNTERNFFWQNRVFSPVTFMGTTGMRGPTGLAIGHSNKESGNVITAIKTSITVKITCLLRRKENDNNKNHQTQKQTFLTEITYGNRGLWPLSYADMTLTVFSSNRDEFTRCWCSCR